MIYLIILRGITSVNCLDFFFFKPRLPSWSHQGRGVGVPSELRTLLPTPSRHVTLSLGLPPSFLSWNQSPSLPAHPSCPVTSVSQRANTGCPAPCQQQHQGCLREEGLTCLQGLCSPSGEVSCTQEELGWGAAPQGRGCSER